MSVMKDSKNKKKKVPSSGYITKAIPHGMIQVGTADDGTKIYSASALIMRLFYPELYKLAPNKTNYIFTGNGSTYTPIKAGDDRYTKFIQNDLLRSSQPIGPEIVVYGKLPQKSKVEQSEDKTDQGEVLPYSIYDPEHPGIKHNLELLAWTHEGRDAWLKAMDALVRKTAPSNHPLQLLAGTALPGLLASSLIAAPMATVAGLATYPFGKLLFNDIWSNMNRPQPISGMNMAYVGGKYADLGYFTPHQLLPKEARGKTWDEQVSSGLQKLGVSKENADLVADFSNPGGIVAAGFGASAGRQVDAAITNFARKKGLSYTPTEYNFDPVGGITRDNKTTMYPATYNYNLNYTSTLPKGMIYNTVGDINNEGVTSAMTKAYADAVAKGDKVTALKLLEEAYKRSGIPKTNLTLNADGSARGWYHGTQYGNHTIFDPELGVTSTNGGQYARGLGIFRGTHLTSDLDAASGYATGGGSNIYTPTPLFLKPNTFMQKLADRVGLFKTRRIFPAENVDDLGLSLKPERTYETLNGPVINNLSKTNNVIYPLYVNPGNNVRTIDFSGRAWSNSPIKFDSDYKVYEYLRDDLYKKYRDNVLYLGPNKDKAYNLFNNHAWSNGLYGKPAYTLEEKPFYYGLRQLRNDGPNWLGINIEEIRTPSNINGAVHDSYRNNYSSLYTPNIYDRAHSVKGFKPNTPLMDELVTFKPNQVKIADITFDPKTGRLIPLNERFDWNNPNALYSKIGEVNKEGLLGGISSLKPKRSIAFPTIGFPAKSWYDIAIDNLVRKQTPVMKAAEQKVFEYLGSEKHIKQIMKSGISRKEAVDIATQMRDNALATEGAISNVNPGTSFLLTSFENGAYSDGFKYKPKKSLIDYKWRFEPKYHINYTDDNNITYDTVIHELGGHAATMGYNPTLAKTVKYYQPLYDKWFPLGRKVYEHNKSLKPKRKPEYESENITKDDADYLKYLEDVDEYSSRARSKLINKNQKDHKVLYDFFTKESVDNLINKVWGITIPIGLGIKFKSENL